MSHIIPLVSSEEPFDLAQFVRTQESPLVAIMFGNTTHKPCLDMIPLFEALAKQGAPIVSCFSVDVEVSQGVAVAAEISKLPTFVFYTTKLSNDQLMVVDQVIGANKPELRDKFVKGHQVVAGYLQSLNGHPSTATPVASPANAANGPAPAVTSYTGPTTASTASTNYVAPAPTAAAAALVPAPAASTNMTTAAVYSTPMNQQPSRPVSSSHQMPNPRPNDIVKKELVDIRNQLIATIRRIEHLYAALQ